MIAKVYRVFDNRLATAEDIKLLMKYSKKIFEEYMLGAKLYIC